MNKIATSLIVIILLTSCKPKLAYKLLVTVEELDVNGEKNLLEITDTIRQTNDSLAYFDGSATFLVYKNSFDLNSYQTSMGRPVSFKVLNAQGDDVRKLLAASAIHFIDAYYEEHYIREKPKIEKRKKIMLEKMKDN